MVSEVEAANVAWVDYEPPETAGAQTHRAAMLQKHAFVAGFIAAMQSRSIPDVEGLVERLEQRETSASKYGGYALVNPDGPEAATALLTLSSEIERKDEALNELISFVGVMCGRGPDCIIPEEVPTPLGVPVKIGAVIRDAKAALSPRLSSGEGAK